MMAVVCRRFARQPLGSPKSAIGYLSDCVLSVTAPLWLSRRRSVNGSAKMKRERITTTHLENKPSARRCVQLIEVTNNMQHPGAFVP